MSLTDSYCTPAWFTALLPPIDLDPCSNSNSTVVARRAIALPEDGLAGEWSGVVWINCPYSNPLPWVRKALASAEASTAMLLKLDTTTRWYAALTTEGAEILLFRKRIRFADAPCTANFPSMLAIIGGREPWQGMLDNLTTQGWLWRGVV